MKEIVIGNIHIRKPSLLKQAGEFFHLSEVQPSDICSFGSDELAEMYPDIYGDRGEIDTGWGGNCQSWRGMRGWWKSFIKQVEKNEQS